MLSGSLVALVTPMDEHGDLDFVSLRQLVEYHIAAGTAGIVAMGTTGESATLDLKEHLQVVSKTLEYAQLVLGGEIEYYLSLGCDHGRMED